MQITKQISDNWTIKLELNGISKGNAQGYIKYLRMIFREVSAIAFALLYPELPPFWLYTYDMFVLFDLYVSGHCHTTGRFIKQNKYDFWVHVYHFLITRRALTHVTV